MSLLRYFQKVGEPSSSATVADASGGMEKNDYLGSSVILDDSSDSDSNSERPEPDYSSLLLVQTTSSEHGEVPESMVHCEQGASVSDDDSSPPQQAVVSCELGASPGDVADYTGHSASISDAVSTSYL